MKFRYLELVGGREDARTPRSLVLWQIQQMLSNLGRMLHRSPEDTNIQRKTGQVLSTFSHDSTDNKGPTDHLGRVYNPRTMEQ